MKAKEHIKSNARAAPPLIYSTSEARANFAEALETAQLDCAVIGFERYGRTVAALAPIEAIYLLAGMGEKIAPDVRRSIERNARSLVQDIQRYATQPRDEKRDGKARHPRMRLSAKAGAKTKSKRRPKS